jgi:choline dehydrogenase
MIWSRGHKNDWDYFADEAGDPGWSYESVLGIYRRIEDWQGTPDSQRRGKGGLVYVEPARDSAGTQGIVAASRAARIYAA